MVVYVLSVKGEEKKKHPKKYMAHVAYQPSFEYLFDIEAKTNRDPFVYSS